MAKTLDQLNADIRELTAQLGKARKALRGYEASADKAADATGRTGAKVRGASLDIQEGKEKLEGFGASLRAVGGDIGPLEDLATAMEKLGPAGFAAAAGVAALIGAAFAVAKFAQVTVEATRAAGELLEGWDNPHIFREQADAIADANEALDDLAFAGQRLQIQFAASLAPTIVDTTNVILSMQLAAEDAAEASVDWSGAISGFFGTLAASVAVVAPPVAGAFALIKLQIDATTESLGWLTEAYEDDVNALKEQQDALNETEHAFDRATDAMGAYLDAADGEFDLLKLTDRERERIDAEERKRRDRRASEEEKARLAKARADEKARKEAEADDAAYWEGWRLESEQAIAAEQAEREEAAAEAQRLLDEQTAAAEKAAETEAQVYADAIVAVQEARKALAQDSVRLVDTVLEAVQDSFDAETASGQKAVLAVFAARKAIALSQIAISTIVAVQRALESAPPPLNAIPAAAMGIAGAANLAAVAAQKPPSFPIGGLIPSDHRLVAAQPGEAVLSTAAVRALGEDAIGGMNRGTSGGGPIEVAMVYRHRVFDRFVADNLRRTDSPLASAIQGSRRKRKRRR